MHVRFANFGLHDGLDRVRMQDPDGHVLGDDFFALPSHLQLRLQVGLREGVVGLVVVIAGESRRRVGMTRIVFGGGIFGDRVDRHGQHGDAVAFRKAEVGVVAAHGGFEGPLEGVEGEFEIDGVVGFVGLEVVVLKD